MRRERQMANLSDAVGTLALKGNWTGEQKLTLLYMLKTLEIGEYNTFTPNFKIALQSLLDTNKAYSQVQDVGYSQRIYIGLISGLNNRSITSLKNMN